MMKTAKMVDPLREMSAHDFDISPPAYEPPAPKISQSYHSSSTASTSASDTLSLSTITTTNPFSEDQAKQAIAKFGSPCATNAEWTPSPQDARLRKLPSLAFTMRIQQRFARQAGDIFNPPCPSFQRPVNLSTSQLSSFDPIECIGKGGKASDGFKPIYSGVILTQRDVSSADWFRFLQDINVAGRVSKSHEAFAAIAPITCRLGPPGGILTNLIRNKLEKKKESLIFETVEEWNARFFANRGLDVFICNGQERLTSTSVGGIIPPLSATYATPIDASLSTMERVDSDSSTSSSSEEDDDDHINEHLSRREGKMAAKQARRERRQEKRQRRHKRKLERRSQRHNRTGQIRQRRAGYDPRGGMVLVIAPRLPNNTPGPSVRAAISISSPAWPNDSKEASYKS